MLYRKLGKTNEEVSILGFGCMRMPIIDGDTTKIDDEKGIKMLRYAIDNGLDYVDTAYPYHGDNTGNGGESEPFVGRALRDGYREKVKLATKLPIWLIQSREQMDEILNQQLKRLETDCIDFYLIHALNKGSWQNMLNLGIIDFLDKIVKDGRVKHVGFSFHDTPDSFKEIVDGYDWGFCQIQYNYLDENYQAGKEGLEYLIEKNIGVIIMEPLRGGNLVNNLPKDILGCFNELEDKKTPAELALKWLWNHKDIAIVLSGMSTMEQVIENMNSAKTAKALTENDLNIVEKVKDIFNKKLKVSCTQCRYCMPCPVGVNIPENFTIYNNANLFNNVPHFGMMYNITLTEKEKASACVECGKCESHCPQHIKIMEELKNVKATFEAPAE